MVVPVQYFGIGDIIFEQTLVRAFGDKVLWPVEPQFAEGLNRAYPDMTFIDKSLLNIDYNRRDEYYKSGMKMLPLRWADVLLNVPYSDCMKAKYLLYGMDWQLWKDSAMWKRDTVKENELQAFLGIADDEPYNLINRTFRSNGSGKAAINVENGYRNIEMSTLEGFNLFDWAKIIENATEIHTVSTAIIYILELLKLKANSVNLYIRRPDETDFRNVAYLLQSHNYIQHL